MSACASSAVGTRIHGGSIFVASPILWQYLGSRDAARPGVAAHAPAAVHATSDAGVALGALGGAKVGAERHLAQRFNFEFDAAALGQLGIRRCEQQGEECYDAPHGCSRGRSCA